MPPIIKKLGFVKAIHAGPTPPVNTLMLWYDTTELGPVKHKYYDTTVGPPAWLPLAGGGVMAAPNYGLFSYS